MIGCQSIGVKTNGNPDWDHIDKTLLWLHSGADHVHCIVQKYHPQTGKAPPTFNVPILQGCHLALVKHLIADLIHSSCEIFGQCLKIAEFFP